MNFIKPFNNSNSIISNIPQQCQYLLLGGSTHGTEQFYKIRSDITKQLIQYNNFNIILFETDWFNMYNINQYLNNKHTTIKNATQALSNITSFPKWLWNNNIIIELIEWIKSYNIKHNKQTYILGIDCYLLTKSLKLLITFLNILDPTLSNTIKSDLHFIFSYNNTQDFIKDIMVGKLKQYDSFCETYFQKLLITIQNNFNSYQKLSNQHNFDIISLISLEQCCEVIINSYEYFKKQYLESSGSNISWNIRDHHMITTIMRLTDKLPDSKFIIWAHNCHIGDSIATSQGIQDFSQNDTWNLGQMVRAMFQNTFNIGFGTHSGTVTSAPDWGHSSKQYVLNIPIEDSIEDIIYKLAHNKNQTNCIINLDNCKNIAPFNQKKKQRMIGVIYNPYNEQSHYITSTLSQHYNLYVFISYTNSLENLT